MIELDVRGLEHPEPLERSVEAFKGLKGDEMFHLIIHRFPKPLLMIAEKQGIAFAWCQKSEEEWHLLFSRDPDADLQERIRRWCDV